MKYSFCQKIKLNIKRFNRLDIHIIISLISRLSSIASCLEGVICF